MILARAYFDSYGPATAADLQWWSGFSKADTNRAIAALGNELTQIDAGGARHLMLVSQVDDLHAIPKSTDPPEGVRLLPVWDAYLMAYRDRRRYLHDDDYNIVYDRGGNSTSVILIDGKPAGVWDRIEEKQTMVIKAVIFDQVVNSVWPQLWDEAVRLARTAGYSSARLIRCASAPNLRAGSQNLLLSPLKDLPGETKYETAIEDTDGR